MCHQQTQPPILCSTLSHFHLLFPEHSCLLSWQECAGMPGLSKSQSHHSCKGDVGDLPMPSVENQSCSGSCQPGQTKFQLPQVLLHLLGLWEGVEAYACWVATATASERAATNPDLVFHFGRGLDELADPSSSHE